MTQNYIGVDLSKDWIDIFDPSHGHHRLPNRAAELRRWLGALPANSFLVFEATSLCDGLILRLATEIGQPFHRLNPLHGWHFASSLNLPKTDRVDAAMLARLGAERQLTPSPGLAAARAELSGRQEQLKRMETQEKNRLSKARCGIVRQGIEDSLKALAAHISRIDAAIQSHLEAHRLLARNAALLETIPGIGRVTAVTLLATMPELGSLDRRRVASLGGLAPRARESGKWRGHRFTGQGRRHVRRALYLAALSAMRSNSPFACFTTTLRDKGKAGKTIAIAIARKLLFIANAVIRDQKAFQIT
jgi:transposase